MVLLNLLFLVGAHPVCLAEAMSVIMPDNVRIAQKKECIDRTYRNARLARYALLSAVAAGMGYAIYNRAVSVPVQAEKSTIPSKPVNEADLMIIQKQIDSLKADNADSWTHWIHSILKRSFLSISLKDIITSGAVGLTTRFIEPLVHIDALWYQLRSEGDFVQSIMNYAKRFDSSERQRRGLGPLTEQEKTRLISMIVEANTLLVHQIEKIIAFVAHKKTDFGAQYPDLEKRAENQIMYMRLAYEEFAKKLTSLCNDTTMSTDNISLRITECAQRFATDFEQAKIHLKALDQELEEAMA